MRFQAVKYLDADFPNELQVGVLDADTGELFPFQGFATAREVSADMNKGRKFSILPYSPVFMLTISDIQPM